MAHIDQLIIAIAVRFVAQTDAPGIAALVDGKIIGTGGELDVPGLALCAFVDDPVFATLLDLFDGNIRHKASPLVIIAHFSCMGKCFSAVDENEIYVGAIIDRPQILPLQNLSPQGEDSVIFLRKI
jgi:hypothetical protein